MSMDMECGFEWLWRSGVYAPRAPIPWAADAFGEQMRSSSFPMEQWNPRLQACWNVELPSFAEVRQIHVLQGRRPTAVLRNMRSCLKMIEKIKNSIEGRFYPRLFETLCSLFRPFEYDLAAPILFLAWWKKICTLFWRFRLAILWFTANGVAWR